MGVGGIILGRRPTNFQFRDEFVSGFIFLKPPGSFSVCCTSKLQSVDQNI